MSGQPVLVAMTGGPFASQIEGYSDSKILAQVMTVLRRMYSRAPDPVQQHISRWRSDKFSKGSFSFITPDSSAKGMYYIIHILYYIICATVSMAVVSANAYLHSSSFCSV
jgi:monoamine oxidase